MRATMVAAAYNVCRLLATPAISSGFQMHIAKPGDALELVTMVAGAAGKLGHL